MKIYMQRYFNFQYAVYFLFGFLLMSCSSTKKMQANATDNNDKKLSSEKSVLQTKLQQGVDFYAYGPDASWELSLDFEKDFTFKRADGFKFNTPAVEGMRAQDANVVRYRAMVESGEMIVEVYRQECTYSGTGKKTPYSVTVEIKRGIDKDFKRVEGCGNYVFDERIHDIWVLQQMNNKAVTGSDLPYIEFNTTDDRVMGKTGCNNFSGRADFRGNKLTIGPLTTSRKFCPNAIYESDFLKAMSPGEWTYEVENGKLVLTRNGKESIVFKKID